MTSDMNFAEQLLVCVVNYMSSATNLPYRPWSMPGDQLPVNQLPANQLPVDKLPAVQLPTAARKVDDPAGLSASYIDRISCPTRQEFYRKLKQELNSKNHMKIPTVIKNVQPETKKNYRQKSHYNMKQQQAMLGKTIALLSLQLAKRGNDIISDLPLKPLSPKRPHIYPSYTSSPKRGVSESDEDKRMNEEPTAKINRIEKNRSNESGYRNKHDYLRNGAVKTSQSLQYPKCREGNLGDLCNSPGLQQRLGQRSPDFEQSLESETSNIYDSLSPGSSNILPYVSSELTGQPKMQVTQDKTSKCKEAKKNSVLYTTKNVSNSAPGKDQQRFTTVTRNVHDALRRKENTSKGRMIIKPLVVNGGNTKCHYLSSSQTLHVDIKPTVFQPVLARQSIAPSVKNRPQTTPQQNRTLPISRKSSSAEILSANKILSPIFRKMSSTYGSGLYPRVIATKGSSIPTIYRMALSRPRTKESSPKTVFRSSTSQEVSSARLNMSRNIQPRNQSMATNLNTATDDCKRTMPSIYTTKTSRLRSDAAVLKRNQSPYGIMDSSRVKSASVATANTRLKPEERGTTLQARPALIKSSGGQTTPFRYSRGPLRQTLTRAPDGTMHPNTLDNITSNRQSDKRPTDKSRLKNCTHFSRCVCQERGKGSARARPLNRAFGSPRGRPMTSPPLTSDAETWFGRKFPDETSPLTRFKSRSPRLRALRSPPSRSPPLLKLSNRETAQSQQFFNKPTQAQRSQEVTQSQRLNRYKLFDKFKPSQQFSKPMDAAMQPQRLKPSGAKSPIRRFKYNVGPTMPLARLPSTERTNLLYRLRSKEGSPLDPLPVRPASQPVRPASQPVRPASHSDRTRNYPVKTANIPQDLNSANQTTDAIMYPTACRNNTPVHLVYNAKPYNNTPFDGNNQNNRSNIFRKKFTDSTESHRDLLNKLSYPMAMKCFKKSMSFHRNLGTTPSRRQNYNRICSTKTKRLLNDNIRNIAANPTTEYLLPGTPDNKSRHWAVSPGYSVSQLERDFRKMKTVTLANNAHQLDTCSEYSESYSQTHYKIKKLCK